MLEEEGGKNDAVGDHTHVLHDVELPVVEQDDHGDQADEHERDARYEYVHRAPLPGQVAHDQYVHHEGREEQYHKDDVRCARENYGEPHPAPCGDSRAEQPPCGGVRVQASLGVHACYKDAHLEHYACADYYSVGRVDYHVVADRV